MNIAVDELARSVFKKSLSDCSVAELKQLTQQYPWFGPLHLLYTKKLQAGSTTIYDDQVQKTALYFNNRLWLQCLLNEREDGSEEWRVESGEKESGEKESGERRVENEKEKQKEKESEERRVESEEWRVESEEAIPLPTFKFQPAPTMNTPLTFEPYHTVDYFASQGIKFREDDKPKDRFGQQLKSFTEWLKAMKRVAPADIATSTGDPSTEKKVEQMAEHSLAERHIITEAMAEVWIKQGNAAKAEEIYRKLSLLDPGKTAYFAARIEDLKKTR